MNIIVYKKYINMVKKMAKTRYDDDIYNKFYKHMVLDSLIYVGKDWYLNFRFEDDTLNIVDWLSFDNGRENLRIYPMIRAFSTLFINHKGIINATLRHGTSWKIYKKMRDYGYFDEASEYLYIDDETNIKITSELNELVTSKKVTNFDDILKDNDMEKYYPYILHDTSFYITDKFVKRYKNFMI